MTPVWAQTLLLSVLLLFVIVKTFGKAVRQWQAEQRQQQKKLRQQGSAPRDADHDVEHAEALLSEPEDSVESESSYNLKERPIDAHFAIHEEVFHPKHHKHLVAHNSRSGVTSLYAGSDLSMKQKKKNNLPPGRPLAAYLG